VDADEQALVDQLPHRRAHGDAADAVVGAQLPLARDHVAGGELLGDHPQEYLAQLLVLGDDAVGDGAGHGRGPRHGTSRWAMG
jgi:hypothetical protein